MAHEIGRLVLFAGVIGCSSSSEPPAPAIDATRLAAQLTPYVEGYGRRTGEIRRMSGFVMVAQHDRPVYAHGFGEADRAHHRVADADTSFRVGSVTKQFTAAAILVLAQDGKLRLDAPIRTYLPEYPAAGAGITLHQLLTQTSGLHDYTDDDELMAARARPLSTAQLLATFWARPLDFPPGQRFAYSNSNYVVLGAVIERVTGRPYGEVLHDRLFEPAGMTRTEYGDAPGAADRALGYKVLGGDAEPIDLSVAFAAGGVRSTATDLVRWHRALSDDRILTEASRRELYTPEQDGYAAGWEISELAGHRLVGHAGGIDGFACDYRRVPDLDLVVVVWSNKEDSGEASEIARAALHASLGDTLEPPEPDGRAVDPAIGARVAGTYRLTAEARATLRGSLPEALWAFDTATLTFDDGHVELHGPGAPIRFEAASATRLIGQAGAVVLDLELPPSGPVSRFALGVMAFHLAYERTP